MRKKILISFLFILSLTGCFENSGKLVSTCTKSETSLSHTHETIYSIEFKNDAVIDVYVTEKYIDSDESVINGIKTSIESNDRFINNLEKNVIKDSLNEYQVKYKLSSDNEILMSKYIYKDKRSSYILELKNEGYECR